MSIDSLVDEIRAEREAYAARFDCDLWAIYRDIKEQERESGRINKQARHAARAFVQKALQVLRNGIHLVILDLFPPGPRDPQGIHKAIWDELIDNDFTLPPDKPLTLASYIGGVVPESFVEPVAVGVALPEMPLFLTPEVYIQLPLERTYQSASEAVPAYWRDVLAAPTP
jgi:hypothetical protein